MDKILRHTWVNMRHRCNNIQHKAYPNYGGRGITVCPQWGSYEQFARDMGPKPTQQHSLDRIDNNQGYYPENCRWATRLEQQRNLRINKHNKSGVSGVRYSARDKRWVARGFYNGKTQELYYGVDYFEAVCRRKAFEYGRRNG